MPAPQEAADAEAGEVSPWQAPPAFLAHALLHFIVLNDLGWSPLVASLRRLSRGWRAATDAALPVLAPRIHSSRHDMGALATRVGGGLRVLRFWVPGRSAVPAHLWARQLAGPGIFSLLVSPAFCSYRRRQLCGSELSE